MAGEAIAVATRRATVSVEPVPPARDRAFGWAFFAWGSAAYLVATLVVLAIGLRRTDGRLVYVLDDPAIHLSVARALAEHGTWGVVPGQFESASSSPTWTVLLAGWLRVVPGPDSIGPLVLNVAASLAVVAVLASVQRVLRPGIGRPLDVLATVALVIVVLFLPGLTFVGMEHPLHIALVLATVVSFHRRQVGWSVRGRPWLPYVLLVAATLTRFETAFLAVGIATALLVTGSGPGLWPPRAARWARPSAVLAVTGATIAAFGGVNVAMGQGLLPNSVLAKGAPRSFGPPLVQAALARIADDPLVAVLTATALGALVLLGARRPAWGFPAVVLVVTVPLHLLFAQFGWYERYQAYLIALGVYVVLGLLADLRSPDQVGVSVIGPPADGASQPWTRWWVVPTLVCLLVAFSGNKPSAVVHAAAAMDETYDQRYQVARFLDRYYDGEPVATGELGYVSLFHEGPVTDIFGLGDREVLLEWERVHHEVPEASYWRDLMVRRDVDVVVVYPSTFGSQVPREWIGVGRLDIGREELTSPDRTMTFYATVPEAVDYLQESLGEFSDDLPDGSTIELNPLARVKADAMLRGA
jgi:hypothetical protein